VIDCKTPEPPRFAHISFALSLAVAFSLCVPSGVSAQVLEQQLLAESPESLADAALQVGDARRGAIVFHQPYMACIKCHSEKADQRQIGPNLAEMNPKPTDAELVDSVLRPSKVIKKGYETLAVATAGGQILQGVLVERNDQAIVLRDAAKDFERVRIPADQIDGERVSKQSMMPAGQVNVLASRQQFLDLVRYLIEIRDGGINRARELEPPPALYAAAPLPEYEKHIDHAGMISSLDDKALKRGAAIFARVCANCHGTHDRPGSLPTSLKFATGKFKNGSDPYTMYQTLTRGFGLMVPQTWMVPEQKYDVIHYVRQQYLKSHNPSQYFAIDDSYLASLPEGDTRGPKPRDIRPWQEMNYGPNLVATYEAGDDGTNFAYKGNAVRLDPGPGGVSRGKSWMIFDFDTLRMAAAWSGKDFIDYKGINFNGQHGIHPRLGGTLHFANPTGPGWARPGTDSFEDSRLVGRDDRHYGPLPRDWAQYRGMYHHGNETIVAYTVGETKVLETQSEINGAAQVFARHFEIGPRRDDMLLQVLHDADLVDKALVSIEPPALASQALAHVVRWGDAASKTSNQEADATLRFDGETFLEVDGADAFDMETKDYTIYARIKTEGNGTIFCKTEAGPKWVPDGKTFFIRNGRPAFDIGWVGVVSAKTRVDDGRWHDVVMIYHADSHEVSFYVDGDAAGGGRLEPHERDAEQVARIGFTAANFPKPSYFEGEIEQVTLLQTALSAEDVAALSGADVTTEKEVVASWNLRNVADDSIGNSIAPAKLAAKVIRGEPAPIAKSANGAILAGLASGEASAVSNLQWSRDEADLRLRIPAGERPLRFTLWMTRLENATSTKEQLAALSFPNPSHDLESLTKGGPPRWPQVVKTPIQFGDDSGPFAVDVLTYPKVNPWLCRMRLTGHDFFSDGDRAAVCDWDGNVWLVSGILAKQENSNPDVPAELTWKRIASGLFQPLGLKIIDDVIHVTCRDQLCRLHDLNGDDAIDWYECINNDHQVTEHFHEFAMGLQTDEQGDFYYAKSARHALPALVPHHGTLLRVSSDGEKTQILANGFRAANGVCVNPDGTFIVTDQEGHWNPKNRINWVEPGGFYGNMYGYHDVTDDSDEAMEQPLCWITNSFDRSPAELLWVDSPAWGPLEGRLLNISYGYGKVFLVPHEKVDGQVQGGMIELPIPQLATGTIRGRFHPADGQLYLSGMFAWAGSRTEPGGFYRLRYTGKPVHLPVELHATTDGLELEFTGDVDPAAAENAENYQVKVWDLKRTKSYGSKHYNERQLKVTKATLDGRRLTLEVPEIEPTWCMEIRYQLKTADGKDLSGVIHNTIHNLTETK